MRSHFKYGDRRFQVDLIDRHPLRIHIVEDEQTRELTFTRELREGEGRLNVEGVTVPYFVTAAPAGTWVTLAGQTFFFAKSKAQSGPEEIHGGFEAPMPGKVIQVKVAEGERVEAGQVLVILEAMKMEHRIEAPAAGTVTTLRCQAGEVVEQGFQLLDFEVDA